MTKSCRLVSAVEGISRENSFALVGKLSDEKILGALYL
jgi:hypothetical protein